MRWELLDDPASDRLVEHRKELGLPKACGPPDDVELEPCARGGSKLEQVTGSGRQPGQTLADDLADAIWAPQLGGRSGDPRGPVAYLHHSRLHERAPELADEEGIAD